MMSFARGLVVNRGLALLPLQTRHAPEMFALIDAHRPFLRQWLDWVDKTQSDADVLTFIRANAAKIDTGAGRTLGVFARGMLIGMCGFSEINHTSRSAVLGCWMAEHAQGRGTR